MPLSLLHNKQISVKSGVLLPMKSGGVQLFIFQKWGGGQFLKWGVMTSPLSMVVTPLLWYHHTILIMGPMSQPLSHKGVNDTFHLSISTLINITLVLVLEAFYVRICHWWLMHERYIVGWSYFTGVSFPFLVTWSYFCHLVSVFRFILACMFLVMVVRFILYVQFI